MESLYVRESKGVQVHVSAEEEPAKEMEVHERLWKWKQAACV